MKRVVTAVTLMALVLVVGAAGDRAQTGTPAGAAATD